MEDVLEVYHRPYNPRFPVICMDEASKQLVGEVRQPLPLRPVNRCGMTRNTSASARVTSSCLSSLFAVTGMSE